MRIDMTLQPENWSEAQNILVVLAHPDDPEFFCGASLARWARAGHHIVYQLICCGDKGWNPKTPVDMTPDALCALRREEQATAAEIIGVKAIHFLDHEDGLLIPDLDLRREIVRIIRHFKPDILVTCDPQNLFASYGLNHPDHRAAGQVVLDAVFPAAGNPFYFPEPLAEKYQPHTPREVWISLTNQPEVSLDVTDFWDIKIQAILEHKSQIQDVPALIERMKSRHTLDSTTESPRYEENFRVIKYG
jgi:LmbE family N-acetylglucosaminyl deacetylase